MPDIYQHWDSDEILAKYNNPRPWAKRFRSEVYFLEKIMKDGMSVLDVGCATGDLYAGLKEKYKNITYVGLDIAEVLIKRAKELFTDATFILGNILNPGVIDKEKRFDLVTATGVFQHEPKSEELLRKMLDQTKDGGCVLFDLKLFHSYPTLRDINLSYCDHEERVYFIVFQLDEIMSFISSLPDVTAIECYGYYSGVNESVRLPQSVNEEVCSTHILLQRGQRDEKTPLKVELNLPAEFITNYFKAKNKN